MTPGQTPEEQLAARIGQGGVDAAKALGWTPPKAPEPVRLVTMEESREAWLKRHYNGLPVEGGRVWSRISESIQRELNDADDWLVRTYCKRIIEGLPVMPNSPKWVYMRGVLCAAHRPDLLRIFCGEGA